MNGYYLPPPLRLGMRLRSVLKLLKPKSKKKFFLNLIWMTTLFVFMTGALTIQYWRGRYDERQIWEPKWQMERDVYRVMPYNDDTTN